MSLEMENGTVFGTEEMSDGYIYGLELLMMSGVPLETC
jgi:hypothetical protein